MICDFLWLSSQANINNDSFVWDFTTGFRVIIMIKANSYTNIRSSRSYQNLKLKKLIVSILLRVTTFTIVIVNSIPTKRNLNQIRKIIAKVQRDEYRHLQTAFIFVRIVSTILSRKENCDIITALRGLNYGII